MVRPDANEWRAFIGQGVLSPTGSVIIPLQSVNRGRMLVRREQVAIGGKLFPRAATKFDGELQLRRVPRGVPIGAVNIRIAEPNLSH